MEKMNLCPSRTFLLILSLFVCAAFSFQASAQSLVSHGDTWRYRKGATANPAGWKTTTDASLDATWLTGQGGFGYADNSAELALCGTILSDMKGSYSTVAMRKSFDVTATVDPTLHLQLTADFDDGFIAWLDGAYLASFNVTGAPNEPLNTANASGSHESSRGDNSAVPASTYDLGEVGARLGVGSHVLAVMGLNSSVGNSSDFVQVFDLALSSGPPPGCVSGPIAADTTWQLSKSPITVCGNVIIESGATLTIEPGVVVQFESGVGLTVADGGRVLAEGVETNRIHFTRAGASAWTGIIVNGSVGSPETRITYADIVGNSATAIHSTGGTLFLDHINFNATDHQYVSLDGSSFIVSYCHFPAPTAKFEPGHGTGGIKSGGHGIFRRNYFGGTIGYSDVVDFTGGNRPQPIVHFINNVMESGQDDGWDLDGTDGWVEGNIFMHVHRNGDTPDSSAAISGGNDSGNTSEVTIVGNLFFDCDNAATAKQGNFFALINNTIVHMTKTGGIDGDTGAVVVEDTTPSPTAFARGMYLEGNIISDVTQLVRNYDPVQTTVTLVNNLLPMTWTGPGTSNTIGDPLLQHVPTVSEAIFASWEAAQIVRQWFSLQPNSPAIATGPDGRDKGGVVPIGVILYGEPTTITTNRDATLHVGFHRTGFDMPIVTGGWPEGMGYTHYKWRLDGIGAWSAETPIDTPITLTGLADGTHFVEVTGKRDSGLYQDDPLFGEDAVVSHSATWTVQSTAETPLQVTSVTRQNNVVSLTFMAQAGQSYSLLSRDALDTAHPWTKLSSTPVDSVSHVVTLTDQNANNSEIRFYEIVTPALP
jgi:hypothetical protein